MADDAPVDPGTDPEVPQPVETQPSADQIATEPAPVDPAANAEVTSADEYTTDSKGNVFKNGTFYRAANSDSEVDPTVDPATGKAQDVYSTDSLAIPTKTAPCTVPPK